MTEKTPRKTKTSSAVKDRYNKKVYDSISIRVPKELAEQFRNKCAENNESQAKIIKAAIENYLNS